MNKTRSGFPKVDSLRMSRSSIAAFMANSLGDARSRQLVDDAARQLGIEAENLDSEQAYKIFESLAARGGAIATVARFAKARFILLSVA